MQTATSEMESKSLDLSICVHHNTLRAPCPKGQGIFVPVGNGGGDGGGVSCTPQRRSGPSPSARRVQYLPASPPRRISN